MNKSYILAFLIALVALLWVMSGMFMTDRPEQAAPDAAGAPAAEEAPADVRVRESTAEDMIATVNITGRTQAVRRVEIKAEIAGQVREILAEQGAVVEEGAVIAKIDERDRRAQLAEARERVDQREIEHNAAAELENKGFNSRVRVAQTRADLESARAALRRAEIELANTEIRAPFGGVIATQAIEIGDYVDAGTVAFNIVDLDPIEVTGFVTEKQVVFIEIGSAVTIRLLNGMEAQGVLSYIAPSADPQTRTFPIEVTIPNPERRIIEGMTAELHIPMARRMAHRISPSFLTLDDEGRVGVKIVNDNNEVEFAPIMIIDDQPDHMWVGGLPDKVRFITVGQDYVAPGQVVNPVKSDTDGLL